VFSAAEKLCYAFYFLTKRVLMKTKLILTCVLGLLLGVTSCKKATETKSSTPLLPGGSKASFSSLASLAYNWSNVAIGGGGYVTGIVIHPSAANRMYIRTDVGGAYRWDATALAWVQILDAVSSSVDGIALDANVTDRVYVGTNAGLYQSNDQGSTWSKLSSFPGTFSGNGDLRWAGEPIAVDPLNSAILFVGSRANGLYKSTTTGSSFSQASGVPTGADVRSVVIDPSGSTGSSSKIYATVAGTGVYMSTNGGTSFSLISGSPTNPNRMAIGASGKLYVTHSTGIKVYDGSAWTDITPSTDAGENYCAISIDPTNTLRLAVAVRTSASGDPMYRSTDGGTTWAKINTSTLPITKSNEPGWWPSSWFSSATSSIAFDPLHSGNMYYTDWFGIWFTANMFQSGSIAFSAQENGHEETDLLTLAAPSPGAGTLVYSGCADVGGFRHISLTSYPTTSLYSTQQITSISYCEQFPQNIAILATNNNDASGIQLFTSANSGGSWTAATLPSGITAGGRIVVSSYNPDKMIYVAHGASGKIYSTSNKGVSWTASTNGPLGADAGTSNDIYDKCFPAAADCVNGSKFYVFQGGFMYMSTDVGVTWAKRNTTAIPTASSWTNVASRPGIDGEAWVSLDGNGLYKLASGASAFTQITTMPIARCFSFGAPQSGSTTALYAYGTLSGGSGNDLYRSLDDGSTWDQISNGQHFSAGVKAIAADRTTFGQVYIATGGRGVMVGHP